MEDPASEDSQTAFEMIESYAETLTQQPLGIGFDLPDWITALQTEVDLISDPLHDSVSRNSRQCLTKPHVEDLANVAAQLNEMPSMPRRNWTSEKNASNDT